MFHVLAAGVAASSDTKALLIVSPQWQMAISAVIPIVVGFITKCTLSTKWKGLLVLVLNAIGTLVLTATMTDAALITAQSLLQWGIGFVTSVALYEGVLQPAGLHSNPGGKLAPTAGIGPALPPDPPPAPPAR